MPLPRTDAPVITSLDNKWEAAAATKSTGIKSSRFGSVVLSCELGQMISFLHAVILTWKPLGVPEGK